MITLKKIKFQYGMDDFQLAIDTFTVPYGESLAVVGPSGSGKTTLLNLIAGVLSPVTGEVCVDGTDIATLVEHKRRSFRLSHMGMVFQSFELVEHLTVIDNILLPARIGSAIILTADLRRHAEYIAEQVGISNKLRCYVDCLSQGERQRVAVCRALLVKPQLLLADEPTGNLDPVNKRRVLEILLNYIQLSGATLIMVTHDPALLNCFDRVVDFEELNRGHNVS